VNIRKVSVFAIFAAASVVPSAAFAATATTLPAKAVTPVATKAAPVAAVPAVTKAAPIAAAPVAAAKSKTLTKTAAPAAVVVAGNFCKKVLVGQSSHDKLGTVLNCVADAKGQPRWTK
jgi:hypothetical protein